MSLPIVAATHVEEMVEVTWSDGSLDRWPDIWLRHACSCDGCGQSIKGVRPRFADRPGRHGTPVVAVTSGDLVVDWGGGHRSCFDAGWLFGHRLSDAARTERERPIITWSTDLEIPAAIPLDQALGEPSTRLELLLQVRDRGFAFLSRVPVHRGRVDEIAGLFGPRRVTNYGGGVYDLVAKENPEITGDMSVPLDPHTDEMYRLEPPAITLFQVVQPAAHGGNSTLIDGLRLAERIAADHRCAFDALTSIPARFHRELDDGHIFDNQALIFPSDRNGNVSGIRFNDRCMAPVDASPADAIRFYEAVELLFDLIIGGQETLEFALGAGDMLAFNNHRVLHGRTEFDPSSGRHVRSFHVDLDEYHSTLRAALRSAGSDDEWMRLGAMAHTSCPVGSKGP